MKKIETFFKYINGWKTVIGVLLVKGTPAAYAAITNLVVTGWGGVMPLAGLKIEYTLIWIGTQLSVVGALHKLIKIDPNKPWLAQMLPPVTKP